MKLTEFNALCEREHEQGGGVVTQIRLSPAAMIELANDILDVPEGTLPDRSGGPEVAGARVGSVVNPVTKTPVIFTVSNCVVDGDGFTGTAEVTRWVQIRQPIPPEPGRESLPPRDAAGYTVGG